MNLLITHHSGHHHWSVNTQPLPEDVSVMLYVTIILVLVGALMMVFESFRLSWKAKFGKKRVWKYHGFNSNGDRIADLDHNCSCNGQTTR